MMGDKLRVCVVGAGDMGSRHALCWHSSALAQVVAVADIVEERARALAGYLQIDAWYTDYRLAIEQSEADVVSVCIPTCLHPEVAIYAAQRGKHVLSEKPIALTLAEADAMIEAARQSGVWLAVGFMRRYSPVLAALREQLGSGALGRPVLYTAQDARGLRPKRAMHDAHANGGPVIDMGVHLYDTWAYAFNARPVEVYAQGLAMAQGRPELAHIGEVACDTAAIHVRFASGDLGTFVVTWGMPPDLVAPDVPDRIFGPQGQAEVQFHAGYQELRLQREGEDWKTVATCEENMYQREIDEVARCIVEGQAPPAGGEQGRAALAVALAALESIRTGKAVSPA